MPKILLVEDDHFYAAIYRKALEAEGYEVTHAAEGEEAFQSAKSEPPALILMDVVVPRRMDGLDGFQLLDALKACETTKHVPVIMLADLATKEDVDHCFLSGACEYLIKAHHPPEEVLKHVRKWLGK